MSEVAIRSIKVVRGEVLNKPVVYFSNHFGFGIEVGGNAHVYALNHPKLGTQLHKIKEKDE